MAVAQHTQLVHAFTPTAKWPVGGLAEAADGSLYGALYAGGRDGAIYRIAPGGAVSILHRFEDRSKPYEAIVRGPDGGLYAVTAAGGDDDAGAIYRIDPVTGAVRLVSAGLQSRGRYATAVSPAADGRLFVIAEGSVQETSGAAVVAVDPTDGTTTVLHTFGTSSQSPHGLAIAPIEVSGSTWLFGTAQRGGTFAKGVVYRTSSVNGQTDILRHFGGPDGANPRGLTRTSDGRIYGITSSGGAEDAGTIFRIDPVTGVVTTVLHIQPSLGHGKGPHARLVEGLDGHLYGTSRANAYTGQPGEFDAIFRIRRLVGGSHALDLVRTYATSVSLTADLVQASDGYIYGAEMSTNAGGVVYRFNPFGGGPAGNPFGYAVRAQFGVAPVAARPAGPPVPAANGFLYGVTQDGGLHLGRGTIYRLDPATGAVTTATALPPPTSCFQSMNSGLVRAADGRLYGTTTCLGVNTIFRFDPATHVATTVYTEPMPYEFYPHGMFQLVRGPGHTLYGLRSKQGFIEVFRFDTQTATPATLTQFRQDGQVAWPQPTLTVARDGSLFVTSVMLDGSGSPLSAEAHVLRIDPSTSVTTVASYLGRRLGTEAPIEALDGRLLLAFGDDRTQRIAALDRATGTWTPLCQTETTRSLVSLTVDPAGRIFGVLRTYYDEHRRPATLLRCDTDAGTLTTHHEFSRLEGLPVGGFAWAGDGLAYGATAFGSTGGGAIVRFSATTTPASIDTDADGLPNAWESTHGLDPHSASGAAGADGDPDGDGRTNAQELAAGTHPRGTETRYLAEGATGAFFSTRIALVNASAEPAVALVRFLPDGGAPITSTLTIPGRTRRTIEPATLPGLASASFSTVVESDRAIVVDRTMQWDGSHYGSHAETATLAPSTTWYLAEGSTSGDFSLFYLLQNPNPSAVTAVVRYLRPSGPPIERTVTLPPTSRTTIAVDAGGPALASTDVSAVVTADAPIIVERAMYFSRPGHAFTAGHASAGVTAPAHEWFLAEGATGSFFDLFVLVANPNPTPAAITVDYLIIGGGVVTKAYTVPAQSRFTIWVDDEQVPGGSGARPLANTALSTTVRSTNGVPIIVERTMWWPGPEAAADYWYEAHNSPGSTATATRWAVADCAIGGADDAETYVLIANPSSRDGVARVQYVTEDGAGSSYVDVALPPRSRTNVSIRATFPQIPARAGIVVESAGAYPVPLVVERATYASPGGVVWASGANALAAPLP